MFLFCNKSLIMAGFFFCEARCKGDILLKFQIKQNKKKIKLDLII